MTTFSLEDREKEEGGGEGRERTVGEEERGRRREEDSGRGGRGRERSWRENEKRELFEKTGDPNVQETVPEILSLEGSPVIPGRRSINVPSNGNEGGWGQTRLQRRDRRT